jgi:CheY-like chemotaxis protein
MRVVAQEQPSKGTRSTDRRQEHIHARTVQAFPKYLISLNTSKHGIPSASGLNNTPIEVAQMQKHVLIADDHRAIRQAVKFVLRQTLDINDYHEATDGCEAVELAERTKPDLIILDLGMPHMDGITAAQKLKKSMPQVPIILFTIYDVGPDQARQLGVDAVVSKAGVAALSKEVRSLLSH